MKWYYAKGGTQKGPVEADDLRRRVAIGEVGAADLVWREGMRDWTPAGQVPELGSYVQGGMPAAVPAPLSQPSQPPGALPPAAGAAGRIPNYLWQAVVVTIFCCWPLGIPAIVYAAKVDGLVARGQIAEAVDASNKAKMWCVLSFAGALALGGLWVLLMVIGGVRVPA